MLITEVAEVQEHISSAEGACIVLFADQAPRLTTFMPLHNALRRAGYNPMLFLWRDATEESIPKGVSGIEHYFCIDPKLFRTLHGVRIIIASELCSVWPGCTTDFAPPPGALSVAIIHSLPDEEGLEFSIMGKIAGKANIPLLFDYVIVPARDRNADKMPVKLRKHFDHVFPRACLEGRTERLCIVPGGYPKVEFLRDRLAAHTGPKDCIIYAPTNVSQARSSVGRHGYDIVSRLLKAFPDKCIVLRPYPGNIGNEALRFVDDLRDEPRFVIDESTDGLAFQDRAATVVTDYSSYAVTFAFASRTPAVFCSFGGDGPGDADPALADPYWDCVGFRVPTIEGLVGAVRESLADDGRRAAQIDSFAKDYLYNPGRTCDYIAAQIPVFMARGTSEDYLDVPRRPYEDGPDAGDIDAYMRRLEKMWKAMSQPDSVKGRSQVAAYRMIRTHLGLGQGEAQ